MIIAKKLSAGRQKRDSVIFPAILFSFGGKSPLPVNAAATINGKIDGIIIFAQFSRPVLIPLENSSVNTNKKTKRITPAATDKKLFFFNSVTPSFLVSVIHNMMSGGIVMRKKNCKRENRGEKLIDSISRSLDIPADAVSGYAHIELSGNREAIIEGCCGVLEYSECTIALNTGRLTVRICGCDLTIVSMQNGQAVIKGMITGLDYTD